MAYLSVPCHHGTGALRLLLANQRHFQQPLLMAQVSHPGTCQAHRCLAFDIRHRQGIHWAGRWPDSVVHEVTNIPVILGSNVKGEADEEEGSVLCVLIV